MVSRARFPWTRKSCAIPGSVGAAPVQNIGAYGVELSELLVCVHAIDCHNGESLVLSNAECEFSYRDSLFKRPEGRHFIITAIVLELSRLCEPRVTYPALRTYGWSLQNDSSW